MRPSAQADDKSSPRSRATAERPSQTDTKTVRNQDDIKVDLNDFFSLRKPKDAKAGLASGLKSMGTGVCAGVLGLIVAPIVGGCKEGAKGALCGLCAGLVGAVVLPVTGAVIGSTQIIRGIINTPEAIIESGKGKIWNHDKREWTEWHVLALPDEEDTDTYNGGAGRGGASGTSSGSRGEREEGDFYALLDVAPTATDDEIRKQYYLLARKWHPDKCPGDPEAKLRFQKLGEAYQVLSNPALRARYDAGGTDSVTDANFVDPSLFFAMLFGNEKFEFLVGELMISGLARMGGNLSQKQMARQQAQREAKLAVNLTALLRRYVEGDEEGFRVAMRDQAAELISQSYGEQLLPCIGEAYRMQAEIHLGNIFMSTVSRVAYQVNILKSQLNGATAAFKVFRAQQDIEAAAKRNKSAAEESSGGGAGDGPAASSEQRAAAEEVALPVMLDAMWAANVVDIQNTLRNVCAAVLQDKSVAKQARQSRMHAMYEMGEIFQAAKAPERPTRTAEDNVNAAMLRVLHKQNNLEPSEEDSAYYYN